KHRRAELLLQEFDLGYRGHDAFLIRAPSLPETAMSAMLSYPERLLKERTFGKPTYSVRANQHPARPLR
ncbi:hypothetical protein, partial [Novosphingobium sp.]|uniref:hypothetical protein n=1 Tax=Novosphingobium sp. TaxID=1874826 RepID=UPI0035B22199